MSKSSLKRTRSQRDIDSELQSVNSEVILIKSLLKSELKHVIAQDKKLFRLAHLCNIDIDKMNNTIKEVDDKIVKALENNSSNISSLITQKKGYETKLKEMKEFQEKNNKKLLEISNLKNTIRKTNKEINGEYADKIYKEIINEISDEIDKIKDKGRISRANTSANTSVEQKRTKISFKNCDICDPDEICDYEHDLCVKIKDMMDVKPNVRKQRYPQGPIGT